MAGVARAMKRHGLTTKPALRLVNTVRSGDVDYYMFDMSGTGRHYTIAKHDFWRGGGTQTCLPQSDLGPALATVSAAVQELQEPPPNREAAPGAREYVRVREMKVGDVVTTMNSQKGKRREVLRIEVGSPFYYVHYVREGEIALRTSKHVPGAKFVLLKRRDESRGP